MTHQHSDEGVSYKLLPGQRFIRKVGVLITFFISVLYITLTASKFTEDTTTLFNVAIGVSAALSGLCFRMASSIEESSEHKRRMAYSGERFLHATLNFLTASILKYAALEINHLEWIQKLGWAAEYPEIIFHSLSLPLFMWAVYDSHTGLTIANDILWERLYNEDDWDSIV